MTRDEILQQARAAFDARAWRRARTAYIAADLESPLEAEDLDRLARAAYLSGQEEESVNFWARAYKGYVAAGAIPPACRAAFWLGFGLLLRGEVARGHGWLARGQRLIERSGVECAEKGLLLLPRAYELMGEGDVQGSLDLNLLAADIGERVGDQDLTTLASLGIAEGLIANGEIQKGVELLDELMVAVGNSEVDELTAGILSCAAILACREVFDLTRATEWTRTLSRMCNSQPELVHYRGICQLHRAQIMQLRGEWRDALTEVEQACGRLAGDPSIGAAHYLLGELYRLRGELDAAEERYRLASEWGWEPQPGLSLLALARGHVESAGASIRRVLDGSHGPLARSKVLGPYAEIMVAGGDVVAARTAADELHEIADRIAAPYLHAQSAHINGCVLLAEGQALAACEALRRAWSLWHRLEARYEAARTRVLLGLACRALEDSDTAEMELDAARTAFAHIGAVHDLAALERLVDRPAPRVEGLTGREIEVLKLVAAGKSNRDIASELVISERTVARHLQNIFLKLDLPSRSAATAFAYRHHLL